MFRRIRVAPGVLGRVRHWSMELLVVSAGVLLALWAQAWFESRREAASHRDTIAQMDAVIRRVLTQTAARVSADACARQRIAELDDALRASTGQWRAMALPNLPEGLRAGYYPPVYLMDTDVVPLQVFETARQNGTMLSLSPRDRQFYERVERQLHWLNDVWVGSNDAFMRVSVLGNDGPLGEAARDEMRQALTSLDVENRVTVLRARALARLARERGMTLSEGDAAEYRQKLERDRGLFGNCVIEVDPLQLTPTRGGAVASG